MYTASRLFRLPGAIFQPKGARFSKIRPTFLERFYFCVLRRAYIFESISCRRPHCLSIWRGTPMETQRPGINLAAENRLNYYIRRVTRPQWISLTRQRENYFLFFPVVEGPKHFRVTLIIYQHSRADPFPFDNNYKKVHAVTRHSLHVKWCVCRRC
jgi:hypothetical protein